MRDDPLFDREPAQETKEYVKPMKTVYIVRHAKSSWKYPELPDDLRPLRTKGIKRTEKVIDALLERGVSVDRIISSHAVRARRTAEMLARGLNYPEENILIEPSVYHSGADGLFELFYDLPPECHSVMIVGHNPALTDLVNYFISPGMEWLPTSAVVSVVFRTDRWEKIALAEKEIRFILEPGKLSGKE